MKRIWITNNQTVTVTPLHVTALQYSLLFWVLFDVFDSIFRVVIVTGIEYKTFEVFTHILNYISENSVLKEKFFLNTLITFLLCFNSQNSRTIKFTIIFVSLPSSGIKNCTGHFYDTLLVDLTLILICSL